MSAVTMVTTDIEFLLFVMTKRENSIMSQIIVGLASKLAFKLILFVVFVELGLAWLVKAYYH